jgi:hypothetical protein
MNLKKEINESSKCRNNEAKYNRNDEKKGLNTERREKKIWKCGREKKATGNARQT